MIITNDSTHSTIAAVDAPLKEPKFPSFESLTGRDGKRHVVFDEDCNEYFEDCRDASCWEADGKEECWYSKKDYQEFRAELRETVYSCIEEQRVGNDDSKNRPFYAAVRQLYLTCRRVDYILHDASLLINEKNRHFQSEQDLARIFDSEEAMELIGMEEQIITSIKQDLRQQRDAVQDVVYDIQCEYNRGLWSLTEMAVEMQESCLNHSQSSGLFAQLMARAQAAQC
eukprot:CAMPEP_0168734044 /NCGR_PEP_ID=MMETSP0724-20121128/8607_1 /TAXON_ID=265536 /ORGANISM="Amphiprora sp., Strain CCMP467" /LENGTH=226 /DNA_ID=CAMNT_0008781129 /DNA_START=186 /DNA_END=866 /DNA_ORIENTATION=-